MLSNTDIIEYWY